MAPGSKDRQVLVIGGAGYIGSVLVGLLLEHGYRVRVLDCLLYDNRHAVTHFEDHQRFDFYQGDFTDEAALADSLDGVSDVVLLAAVVGDPLCKKYPELAKKINETGTLELLGRLDGCGLNRLIFMSTCSNYGLRETDAEATEESRLNPQSLYAETKVAVERHILRSVSRFDFRPVILRCATAYGLSPRMRFDLTVNEFTRDLALGRELIVYDADTWRPYCHTADISKAILATLEAPLDKVAGEVFNVGAPGENYTKRMLVDALTQELPQAKIRHREGSVDPRNYRVSFDKVRAALDFGTDHTVKEFIPLLARLVTAGEFRGDDFGYGNYQIREDFA